MGSEWWLEDTDDKSVNFGKRFRFCFEEFKADDLRELIKAYIRQNYRTASKALSSIYSIYTRFKRFNLFASKNGINSLTDFSTNDADNFVAFLRLYISEQTKKPLSYKTQETTLSALKTIVYWGQIFAPELVPAQEVFVGNEHPDSNANHKIEYIPDDVVRQINGALLIEENPYIKYGLTILLSTGMRISELLNLEVGCVTPHLINGDTLTMYDFKKRRQYRKIPINPACADAITRLTEITDEFRKKADDSIKKCLFLYETSNCGIGSWQIKVISGYAFKTWVIGYTNGGVYYPGFMDRHNIIGSDGEIYKIKIHQFRKTVATDMFSKNVDVKIIQEFLRHNSPRTTKKYYADDKDIDRAEIFEKVGVIGNINRIDSSAMADEDELAWFNENKNRAAKMCDGYCTMPVVDGEICERLVNRQKCYSCSRYITTPEYLQEHRNHLAELEAQLAANIYGTHYATHLSPTIAILKDIIVRLEAVEYEH